MRGLAARCNLLGRLVVPAALLSVVAMPSSVAAQSEVIGVAAAIRNSVLIRRAGTPRPAPAVLRQRMALNDEVLTGRDSQLQILLLDRSTFTIGSSARLRLDRFVYDPRRNTRAVGVEVTKGAFRFISGRRPGPSATRVVVKTPSAAIAIRGTILEGVVGPEATTIAESALATGSAARGDREAATLIVLRGPGAQAQAETPRGAIDVRAGTAAFVLDRPSLALYFPGGGRPPAGPFTISPAALMVLQQLLALPLAAAVVPLPQSAPQAGSASPGSGLAAADTLATVATAAATAAASQVAPSLDDSLDQPLSP